MRKGDVTRGRIVRSASRLIEAQGYRATGLKQVLEESHAPRGSFYFHFPNGKTDLAVAVVEDHAVTFGEALSGLFDNAPSALAAAGIAIDFLATRIEETHCESGCPVSAIAFEMANRSRRLRGSTHEAYEGWSARISARLVLDGHPEETAMSLARTLLCAIEGALILCRAYGGRGPLDDVKSQLEHLLKH